MTFPNDGEGYSARNEDFEFLHLTIDAIHALRQQIAPLGMTRDDYLFMCDALEHALYREGVTDADVRLQGSSAKFFSSWHKRMPYSRESLAEIIRGLRGHTPESYECDPILQCITAQWPVGCRPVRRPFDALYVLGVDKSPSDYDIQISSDQMIGLVKWELAIRKLDPDQISTDNEHYGFVIKEYTERFMPHISEAIARISKRLEVLGRNRPVTWALFPSCGPNKNDDDPRLSSHFQEDDWIIAFPPRDLAAVS